MPRVRTGAVIKRGSAIYARIRFVDENGILRSKERKAKNRTHAKEILRDWDRDSSANGATSVLSDNATFGDLATIYRESRLIPAEYHTHGDRVTKVAGLRSVAGPIRWLKVLSAHFGRTKLRGITHSAIRDFKLMRLRTPIASHGISPARQRAIASVNRELELLRAMLNFAVREKMLPSSPFTEGESLISKSGENRRERILTFDEEARLLAACTAPRKSTYLLRGKEVTTVFKSRRGFLEALIVVASWGFLKSIHIWLSIY